MGPDLDLPSLARLLVCPLLALERSHKRPRASASAGALLLQGELCPKCASTSDPKRSCLSPMLLLQAEASNPSARHGNDSQAGATHGQTKAHLFRLLRLVSAGS